jgi:hypothetical protein
MAKLALVTGASYGIGKATPPPHAPRSTKSEEPVCLLDSRERQPPLWTTSSDPGWMADAGFRQTYLEQPVGPDSMVVGMK